VQPTADDGDGKVPRLPAVSCRRDLNFVWHLNQCHGV